MFLYGDFGDDSHFIKFATTVYLSSPGISETWVLLPLIIPSAVGAVKIKFLLGKFLLIHWIINVSFGFNPLIPNFSRPQIDVVFPNPLFARTNIFAIILPLLF